MVVLHPSDLMHGRNILGDILIDEFVRDGFTGILMIGKRIGLLDDDWRKEN